MKSKSACLFIALLLVCGHAFATKQPLPLPNPDARASATATASQQQNASAQQSQTSITNTYDQDQITFTEPRQLAIAPDAIAPNIYPSAVCYTGQSLGASFGNSGFGAGLTGGKTKLDADCSKRETARSFAAIGNLFAANALLCATSDAKEVFAEHCPPVPVQLLAPPTAAAPVDLTPYVTRTELVERDHKILEAATAK